MDQIVSYPITVQSEEPLTMEEKKKNQTNPKVDSISHQRIQHNNKRQIFFFLFFFFFSNGSGYFGDINWQRDANEMFSWKIMIGDQKTNQRQGSGLSPSGP